METGKEISPGLDASRDPRSLNGLIECRDRLFSAGDLVAVVETAADWLWETDGEHRFTWISDGFFVISDVERSSVIGKWRLETLMKAKSGDHPSVQLADLRAGRPFRGFIHEFGQGGEACRWLSISGAPRFDASGRFLGYRGTGSNVTALLSLRESALAEATEQAERLLSDLQRTLDMLDLGVVVLDPGLKAEMINKAFYSIWRVGLDEVSVGDPFRALMDVNRHNGIYEVADEDWESYVASRLEEIRAGDVAPREFRRADGCTMIYSVTSLSGGKRLVSYYDITEQKEREAEAEAARRHLSNVLESLPAGVVIYDRDDKFVFANRKIREWTPGLNPVWKSGCTFRDAAELGHSLGYFRASGDPTVDVLYGTDKQAWLEAYMRRHAEPQNVYERRQDDGRWIQAFDTHTEDGSFVGVRVEITELKGREKALREAEQRAILADRAKSEFLANMSHEIRTPMNGVLGMAELLAKTELDAKQKTFTDIIVKSGNALLTIINDILDFSKIDAGQLVLDPQPFQLAEAIEDVATLVSTRAKEKDLEMIVRVAPDLHDSFVGDVGRIRQIITNLLGNAVKFTDSGHVLVDVTGENLGEETRLRVQVTDTGIGIPADKLKLVFDKFSQVDASSTRRHEGTGLGLAITSRLVEMMGGGIGVESVEGEGSTFWFTVALPRTGQAERGKATPVDVSGARVLVIDDNAVNRSILLEQMAVWGFDACAAESGPEGIAVLHAVLERGLTVDCIILDYQMPGMTGADVARIVRATPAVVDTPIVMLTSVDQSLSHVSYRDLAIDAQLIKPARSAVLLQTLVGTIQKRRFLAADHLSTPEATMPAEPTVASAAVPVRERELRLAVRPGSPSDRSRVDILVAEDNEVNQLVFSQILAETGCTFEIVGNGRLAVEVFEAMMPRMVLMDVSMPEMNGLEATGRIRELEKRTGGHVPIIGVTAHALKGDRERCLEAGMDDYLSKPISPKALMEKIGRWTMAGRDERAAS
ncbi:response regulator [Aquamicrobium sp. LC103]|nr:response regulator [Aquamicrobium sp. LC103]